MTNELTRSDIEALHTLRVRLQQTRLTERARLAREVDRLFSRRQRGTDFDAALLALAGAIDSSAAKVDLLRSLPLRVTCDPDLPIASHREAILAALVKHQVLILCGATGSGKTTQLPKLCLAAGRGAFGLIGHTQPRRIAARAIASRLAEELGTTVGGGVGFQVRFNDRVGPDCRVKLMTDGILLKELESDRSLVRYDTLIIDEAHERSLNIDLLLGVLKGVLEKRADLKLIITSATIDPQKFSKFFHDAPIIEVSGRSYPVEIKYRPLSGDDEDAVELSLPEGVVAAVDELDATARGDVLVFLPGEKQIRECNDALSRAKLLNSEVLPLYSRLSTRDQEKIFERHTQRRVVLATNVAETSLTVPGIRNVVDSGLARISRYSVRGKVQRLPIEKISKASADQRKGRCGREREGTCIRLFSEEDFVTREEFTPPEVLRTNLASVILRLAVLELGEPETFPFIDPPDTRLINDGYRLLQELRAVDADRRVTSLGRQIASLPVDPRLARMLISASRHACLAEMLVIASFLEIQDPRERPSDTQQQADQAHAVFADSRSDFVAALNLWKAFHEQAATVSGNQLRKWCREKFVSYVRMREWQELHRQLGGAVEEIELKVNQVAAEYADLHHAILTGFLGSIGQLDEKRDYAGARGTRFTIAPGTPLASKPPKWIVAANITETTRVFARMVASVEPAWIEAAGSHLLKRSYAEPQWVEERGFVSARESLSLYGLMLIADRRINYGSVAPKEAREIFVREALVEGRSKFRAEFLRHNGELRAQVETMEAKIRRRDILADENAQCAFYLARLPEHINSVAAMEKWLKEKARGAPAARQSDRTSDLRMTLNDLMRRDASEVTVEQYPEIAEIGANELAISYRFEPGAVDDGATLTVPEPLLDTLQSEKLVWLVPAWRKEILTEMLRGLPKEQRKQFVPVPEAAMRGLREVGDAPSMTRAVADWITRESQRTLTAEQLMEIPLLEHLRINLRVIGLDGRMLAQGRDIARLRREVRKTRTQTVSASSAIHRAWEFGELPQERVVERNGIKFTIYPALIAEEEGVVVSEQGNAVDASVLTRRGVIRLAMLALPQQVKYLRQEFKDNRDLNLLARGVKTSRPLLDQFVERVFGECFDYEEEKTPRNKAEFAALIDARRAAIGDTAKRVAATLLEILEALRVVRKSLSERSSAPAKMAVADVEAQIESLITPEFLVEIGNPWVEYLPRYLRAIAKRLERLPSNIKRDAELTTKIAQFATAYRELKPHSSVGARPELERFRWMIEEYRVSLFAQDLRTSMTVSDKRLAEQLQRAKDESAR